ncbi:MAG: CvpA family protein [bacterium]|nr:CvpA family protein [bacterium]
MSLFDIVLVCIVAGFALFGLWFGLIHTLGSLIGTIFGVYLASHYYAPVADWLIQITGWGENISKVIIFTIAFIIINRLVGFAFWIVDKILSFFTSLPFISGINRLLGLLFGLFEGLLVIGVVLYFIVRFPLGDKFMAMLAASKIAPITVKLASILWPLLPEAIRVLRSTVEGIL